MMDIYKSRTWTMDLDEEINDLPELKLLHGKSVMITGVTGLVCSALADLLIRYNELSDGDINIIAAGRSVEKIKERFRPYSQKPYMRYIYFDAAEADGAIEPAADYIIHGAGNASPDIVIRQPVETMMSNLTGTKRLLDHARKHDAERFLFVSSSEVYGRSDDELPIREDGYAYVDLLDPRSSYPAAKRAAETLCVSYMDEYGVDSVIVRPGHVYGPTASEADIRVSSAWAYAAAEGRSIVMKSDGAQIRSYCYCPDAAKAIIKVLLLGESGDAYNISDQDSVASIREMAGVLSRSAGVELKLDIPTDSEKRAFNPMKNSSLDASSLSALGWRGLFDIERGLDHTVRVIRESREL